MSFGPVLDAALEAQQACINTGYRFCVIGGVALQRWGEPRFTADADLSVLVEPGQESQAVRSLLDELPARIEDAPAGIQGTVYLSHTDVTASESLPGRNELMLVGLVYCPQKSCPQKSDDGFGGGDLWATFCDADGGLGRACQSRAGSQLRDPRLLPDGDAGRKIPVLLAKAQRTAGRLAERFRRRRVLGRRRGHRTPAIHNGYAD